MKIIVLSITPYKEKDGIVKAISENESLTFLARGIKDPKSKNSALYAKKNPALKEVTSSMREIHYGTKGCSLRPTLFCVFSMPSSTLEYRYNFTVRVFLRNFSGVFKVCWVTGHMDERLGHGHLRVCIVLQALKETFQRFAGMPLI